MSGRKRWLWRYLWGWTLLVLGLTWAGLAGVAYVTGLQEAKAITDRHLQASADLLLRVKELGSLVPTEPAQGDVDLITRLRHSDRDLRVLAWENGRLTWDTHGMAPLLPTPLADGLQDLELPGDDPDSRQRAWRLYVVSDAAQAGVTRQVAVLSDTAIHVRLALDMAEHLVRPAIVVFPLMALLLIWAIRRGLRPLQQLSDDMAALDVRAGQRLEGQQAFSELESTVQAIHHLVDQLQHQWAREREFNADVAHELRTPLTSAVLQAHVAQTADSIEERAQALQRVEAETLRAAGILSQLLELAHAHRAERMHASAIDLCELARQACTQHLAFAHDSGQTLGLSVPDAPLPVPAQAELLRLALRNLVDNALRHNPRGTQVEIAVQHQANGEVTLSVSDDGHFDPRGSSRPGMGVGLTLVRRIAHAMGVGFRHEPGRSPYQTRFVLSWPSAESPQ